MEKKCLVTRLKAVVNDSSLKKLGVMEVKFAAGRNNSFQLRNATDSAVVLKVVAGNGTIGLNSNSHSQQQTIAPGANVWVNINATTQMTVEVSNKYGLSNVNLRAGDEIDVLDLSYNALLVFEISQANVSGTTDCLKNSRDSLTFLNIANMPNFVVTDVVYELHNVETISINKVSPQSVNLDISKFAGLKNLKTFNAYDQNTWSSTSLRGVSLPPIFSSNTNYPLLFATEADAERFLVNMASCTGANDRTDKFIHIDKRTQTEACKNAIRTLVGRGIRVIVNGTDQTE